MSMIEWVHWAIALSAVGQTLFVLLYLTAIRRWWRDAVAWSLFDKAVLLAVIFDLAVVAIWWTVPRVVFVVLYWLIAVAIWQQFLTLARQRLARRRRIRSSVG